MPTQARINEVVALLGITPLDRDYKRVCDEAAKGWPPFRIAQWLGWSEERWRKLVGK